MYFNDIIVFANGKTVKFGTEISRADKLNSVSVELLQLTVDQEQLVFYI